MPRGHNGAVVFVVKSGRAKVDQAYFRVFNDLDLLFLCIL